MKQMESLPVGYIYYARKFLNEPGYHSTAFIYATVTEEGYGTLKISDCSRPIDLDLDAYYNEEDSGCDNTINKLDILISTLQDLRKAYIAVSKKRGWKPKSTRKKAQ